jgi:hypothetical protein
MNCLLMHDCYHNSFFAFKVHGFIYPNEVGILEVGVNRSIF